MIIDSKQWLGVVSLVISAVQYGPYCVSTFKGRIKPHAFSYLIWSISSGVVFVAQAMNNGGAGSWAKAFSVLACLLVAGLSASRGMTYVTRSDWAMLALAMFAIVLWVITSNPLLAVIVITVVDTLAYGPSFRKALLFPREDAPSTYVIGWAKHLFSLLALDSYTVTTTLSSVCTVLANAALITLILYRRAAVTRDKIKAGEA